MVYDFPDLVVVIVGRSRLLLFPSLSLCISLSISSQQFPFCRSPTLPLLRPVGSIWPGGGSKKIFRVDGGRCWSSSSSSSTDFGAYTRLQKGYNIYGIINSSWLTSIGLHDVLMPSARQIIDSPSLLVSLSRSLSLIPRFSLAGWLAGSIYPGWP